MAPHLATRVDLSSAQAQLPGSRVINVSHTYTDQETEYIAALILQEVSGADSMEEAVRRLNAVSEHETPVGLPDE
jgi:hypothetical protein